MITLINLEFQKAGFTVWPSSKNFGEIENTADLDQAVTIRLLKQSDQCSWPGLSKYLRSLK